MSATSYVAGRPLPEVAEWGISADDSISPRPLHTFDDEQRLPFSNPVKPIAEAIGSPQLWSPPSPSTSSQFPGLRSSSFSSSPTTSSNPISTAFFPLLLSSSVSPTDLSPVNFDPSTSPPLAAVRAVRATALVAVVVPEDAAVVERLRHRTIDKMRRQRESSLLRLPSPSPSPSHKRRRSSATSTAAKAPERVALLEAACTRLQAVECSMQRRLLDCRRRWAIRSWPSAASATPTA